MRVSGYNEAHMKKSRNTLLFVLGIGILIPSMACAAFTKSLTVGSRDPEVSRLQSVLKEWGFYSYPEITGYYGSFTAQAVKSFQISNGIEPVGVVGPLTRKILNALIGEAPIATTPTSVTTPPSTSNITTPVTTSGATVFSTADAYSGDSVNYTPATASRWSVVNGIGEDVNNKKLFLNTSSYSERSGSRLGELTVLNGRSYSAFTLTMKARTNEALVPGTFNDFAVVFGYQNENNYNYMMFNSHAPYTQLHMVINGQRATLATATRAGILDTNEHTIEVIRSGLTVVVRVDGQEIVRAMDTRMAKSGLVGVGSFDDSAYFDDIVIVPSATIPPQPTQVPATPTLAAVASSQTQINLSWNDVSNEVGYTIERAPAQTTNWITVATVNANITTYSDTGLTANTAYTYRMKARGVSGDSAYSATVTSSTLPQSTSATKPNANNTGPTNPSALVATGSITVTQNNAVIQNVDVTGRIEIAANNVTIRNFRIRDGGIRRFSAIEVLPGFTGAVIEDGEISMSVSDNGISGSNFTARRIHMHDMWTDTFRVGSNVVIENSYIHDIGLGQASGVHTDVIQTLGGSNVVIRNNNFDVNSTVSGIIQMNESNGNPLPISNWLVENNWFDGSAIMIRSYADPSIRYINNRIGRHAYYGVLFNSPPIYLRDAILTNGVSWKCNVWMDSGPTTVNGQPTGPSVVAGTVVYSQDTCTTPPPLAQVPVTQVPSVGHTGFAGQLANVYSGFLAVVAAFFGNF